MEKIAIPEETFHFEYTLNPPFSSQSLRFLIFDPRPLLNLRTNGSPIVGKIVYGTGSGNSGVKGVGKSIKGHLLGGEKQKRYETIFPEKV